MPLTTRLAPVRWPLHAGETTGAERMFAQGGFATPDKRARIVPVQWRAPDTMPTREYSVVLNTGRIRDQWHTMTRTGRVAQLMTHQDQPSLMLHPHDAGKVGVVAGDPWSASRPSMAS